MPSGFAGAAAVDVSRAESDRLAQEAELLEQQLAQLRNLQQIQRAGPPPAPEPADADDWGGLGALSNGARGGSRQRGAAARAGETEDDLMASGGGGNSGFRWRGSAGPLEGEEDEFSATPRQYFDGGFDNEAVAPPARPPRKPVLKAGEWRDVESFFESIGLGRFGYAKLFRDRGLDTPEAIERIDPVKLRKLGITDNKHALKLRMGIAELRTFGSKDVGSASVSAVGPSPKAPSSPPIPLAVSATGGSAAASPSSLQMVAPGLPPPEAPLRGPGRPRAGSANSSAPAPPPPSSGGSRSSNGSAVRAPKARQPSFDGERALAAGRISVAVESPLAAAQPAALVRSASTSAASRRRTPPPPSVASVVAGALSRRRASSVSPADSSRRPETEVARPTSSRRPMAPPRGCPPPRPPVVR